MPCLKRHVQFAVIATAHYGTVSTTAECDAKNSCYFVKYLMFCKPPAIESAFPRAARFLSGKHDGMRFSARTGNSSSKSRAAVGEDILGKSLNSALAMQRIDNAALPQPAGYFPRACSAGELPTRPPEWIGEHGHDRAAVCPPSLHDGTGLSIEAVAITASETFG